MSRAETLERCIEEAKRFIIVASQVPIMNFGRDLEGSKVKYINPGKESGAAKRASMDLSRALSDYRQGR